MTIGMVRQRLADLGLALPDAAPTSEFLAATRLGDLVYVSGHAPYADGAFRYRGRVGQDLDLAEARQAAVLAVLGCLRTLEQALGTLDAVERIPKVNGYVHCVPGYEPLPRVTDAASQVLVEVFGEAGRHARTTVGVASLPSGVALELELTALAVSRARPAALNAAVEASARSLAEDPEDPALSAVKVCSRGTGREQRLPCAGDQPITDDLSSGTFGLSRQRSEDDGYQVSRRMARLERLKTVHVVERART